MVSVLEEFPAFGAALAPEEFARASTQLRAPAVTLGRGSHQLGLVGSGDLLALLVLDGWLMRTVILAGRRCATLSGPGTTMRPWDEHEWFSTIPYEISWRTLETTRVLLFDDHLLAVIARWPELVRSIFRGGSERGHTQMMLTVIQSLQHVELRLRIVLWMYADRYGQTTCDGVVLPVRLSHQDLAEMIGTQRPTVSAHLAELSARGEVVRRPDRTWLLVGAPPGEIDDLRIRAGHSQDR